MTSGQDIALELYQGILLFSRVCLPYHPDEQGHQAVVISIRPFHVNNRIRAKKVR